MRFFLGAAIGNRTRIEGSTNLSVNRYTIAAIFYVCWWAAVGRPPTHVPQLYQFLEKSRVFLQTSHYKDILYTIYSMDQETLIVGIFFIGMIGAGLGFYLTKFIMGI